MSILSFLFRKKKKKEQPIIKQRPERHYYSGTGYGDSYDSFTSIGNLFNSPSPLCDGNDKSDTPSPSHSSDHQSYDSGSSYDSSSHSSSSDSSSYDSGSSSSDSSSCDSGSSSSD